MSLAGLRPAKAMVLSGEEGTLRNLRVSLTTYLPVKPEAPKMMRSKAVLGLSFGIADMAGE